jgi:hypothetical protein
VRGNSQALFGKRPTEKDLAMGTSPAVHFTRCGGGWKRSDLTTVTGVAQPAGKPAATKAPGPTVRTRHRASPRPYVILAWWPDMAAGRCFQ